jgi:hypothetical protein
LICDTVASLDARHSRNASGAEGGRTEIPSLSPRHQPGYQMAKALTTGTAGRCLGAVRAELAPRCLPPVHGGAPGGASVEIAAVQAVWAEGGQDRGFRCRNDGHERLRHEREITLARDEAILVKSCPVHPRTVPHVPGWDQWFTASYGRPWSGSFRSRHALLRPKIARRGVDKEFVAELCSAYLCEQLRILTERIDYGPY